MRVTSNEEKLELAISYILIAGVTVSVSIEAIGLLSYYYANRNVNIVFRPDFALQGTDFFKYSENAFLLLIFGSWTPIHILAFGLVLLMMTPFVRVVASVVYFVSSKNFKYLSITLFVLLILTASLLLH
jgi:uncharacterized membrane protein